MYKPSINDSLPMTQRLTTPSILIPTALLFALLPYLFAGAMGTAAEGTTGLGAFHSAAESVYCEKGFTVVAGVFLVEVVLAVGLWAATRRGAWLTMAAGVLLAALPYLFAWQTTTSACTRGQAFFWESILIDVMILAILAVSYNLMFGFSGIVSFGHAAFFGTGAYTAGLLAAKTDMPWWAAILLTLAIGVVIALIKGGVGLRIKGLYFALFTLAFAEIIFLLAGNRLLVDITGAEDGITFPVPDMLNATTNRLFFYYVTFIIFVLAYLFVQRLIHSPPGKVLTALRDNEARAQTLGYNTFQFKLLAIVVAGLLATGAGILRGIALKGASPNVLGLDFTMTPLLMTIIGGQGTFAGPVVGAFLLRLLEQVLRDTVIHIGSWEINIGERWSLILGAFFIAVVLLFPQGIVGTRFRRKPKQNDP